MKPGFLKLSDGTLLNPMWVELATPSFDEKDKTKLVKLNVMLAGKASDYTGDDAVSIYMALSADAEKAQAA